MLFQNIAREVEDQIGGKTRRSCSLCCKRNRVFAPCRQQSIKEIAVVATCRKVDIHQTGKRGVAYWLDVIGESVLIVVGVDDLFPEHLAAGGDFGDEGVDGVLPRAVGCDGEDALAIPGGILGELAEDVEVAVAVGDGAFDQAAFLRGAVAFCPVEVLGVGGER